MIRIIMCSTLKRLAENARSCIQLAVFMDIHAVEVSDGGDWNFTDVDWVSSCICLSSQYSWTILHAHHITSRSIHGRERGSLYCTALYYTGPTEMSQISKIYIQSFFQYSNINYDNKIRCTVKQLPTITMTQQQCIGC